MRMRIVSSIFLALFVGVTALQAVAGETDPAQRASHRTVAAFLAGHDWVRSAPSRHLVACKPDGAPCSTDTDCCSGVCKSLAEGHACVPK
jgi:hypothetical protein